MDRPKYYREELFRAPAPSWCKPAVALLWLPLLVAAAVVVALWMER